MSRLSIAALAVTLALVLSGCNSATGNDTPASAATPAVHGVVTLICPSGNPPAGSKILVLLYAGKPPVASVRSIAREPSAVATASVPATKAGDYSYSITGVADGLYTAYIVLTNADADLSTTALVNSIQVSGGAATVPTQTITYDPKS